MASIKDRANTLWYKFGSDEKAIQHLNKLKGTNLSASTFRRWRKGESKPKDEGMAKTLNRMVGQYKSNDDTMAEIVVQSNKKWRAKERRDVYSEIGKSFDAQTAKNILASLPTSSPKNFSLKVEDDGGELILPSETLQDEIRIESMVEGLNEIRYSYVEDGVKMKGRMSRADFVKYYSQNDEAYKAVYLQARNSNSSQDWVVFRQVHGARGGSGAV